MSSIFVMIFIDLSEQALDEMAALIYPAEKRGPAEGVVLVMQISDSPHIVLK